MSSLKKSRSSHSLALTAAGLVLLTAAGCSTIKPKPFTASEIATATAASATAARADVPALAGPLSIEESLARAFKYNLDQRVRMTEQAIALHVWKAGRYDMLPKVLASAGYRYRSEELVTNSRDSVTGLPSLANPFISSERESELYDLGASWNVLDFTLGYYNAKQNADRILVAAENRRKAMHTLGRDVHVAFWRMASAQKLRGDVRTTLTEAESALADSAQAGDEALQAPVDQLRYQRQILENIRLLANIDKEFASARATLASLVNLPLDQEFTVVEPAAPSAEALLDVPAERMETIALNRNADLKGALYQERIASQEVRKAWAKALPNLSLNYNIRHSSDEFLINDHWQEAAAVLSQNLTHLLALPANRRTALAGVELARQKRAAQQMALLAQVHIARINLASQYRNLQLADRIWAIDDRIKRHTAEREEAQAGSRLSKVAANAAAIVSQLRRYQALADYYTANGALQSTLGLEADLDSVSDQSLETLSANIRAWMQAWDAGQFQEPALEPAAAAPALASR